MRFRLGVCGAEEHVEAVKYSFEGVEWQGISTDAKDLVSGLLKADISSRLTAQQALQHRWFTTTQGDRRSHYSRFTVPQLRAACKAGGAPVRGNKTALIERLIDREQETEQEQGRKKQCDRKGNTKGNATGRVGSTAGAEAGPGPGMETTKNSGNESMSASEKRKMSRRRWEKSKKQKENAFI